MNYKKIILLLICLLTTFSLVGCGGSKKKEEKLKNVQLTEKQVAEQKAKLAAEEEKKNKAKRQVPVRQIVGLSETDSKLVFLNSLLENKSSILETTKTSGGYVYYLSAPTTGTGQQEFPERQGNVFIKITTEFDENNIEMEKEIQFQIDSKGDTIINLNAPENVVFEKVYGLPLKEVNKIYNGHLKSYLSDRSNKKQTYTSSFEVNNIWMVVAETTFFEYDTYGKKIKQTFKLDIKKQEKLIKNRYTEFYKTLSKKGYNLDYLNADNYNFNKESGNYKVSYKVSPKMLVFEIEGYENAFYKNWENYLQEIKNIDIYKDVNFREVSFGVKNVMNKFTDIPFNLDDKQQYSSVKRVDDHTYSTSFKLYDKSGIAKYMIEIICHIENNETNNNKLEIKYVPLFLKERGK